MGHALDATSRGNVTEYLEADVMEFGFGLVIGLVVGAIVGYGFAMWLNGVLQ